MGEDPEKTKCLKRAEEKLVGQIKSSKKARMPERSSSIRLRRRNRGEEGRQEFLKSRRSGEWAHRLVVVCFISFYPDIAPLTLM